MGVDVSLYASGTVTEQQLADANEYVTNHSPAGFGMNWDAWRKKEPSHVGPFLRRAEGEWDGEPDVVQYGTHTRYFGAGHPRGAFNWPAIYGAIRVLQRALPQCEIHYLGDDASGFIGDIDTVRSDEMLSVVTEERLAAMWELYLS